MNTRASGMATDDLGTSASVLSGLSALGSAPGSAALALFCVSETAEAHRTHCRLLSPGFSQRPFGDGQPRAREVEDDAGQLETWLGYSLVCESGASQVAQWWGKKKKAPPAQQERWIQSLGREDPLEKEIPGCPLQYSCRENPMDRGAWCPTVHRVTKSPT